MEQPDACPSHLIRNPNHQTWAMAPPAGPLTPSPTPMQLTGGRQGETTQLLLSAHMQLTLVLEPVSSKEQSKQSICMVTHICKILNGHVACIGNVELLILVHAIVQTAGTLPHALNFDPCYQVSTCLSTVVRNLCKWNSCYVQRQTGYRGCTAGLANSGV